MRGMLIFDNDADLSGFQAWLNITHPDVQETVFGPQHGPYLATIPPIILEPEVLARAIWANPPKVPIVRYPGTKWESLTDDDRMALLARAEVVLAELGVPR